MPSIVTGKLGSIHMLIPVIPTRVHKVPQHRFQSFDGTFCLPICLRTVRSAHFQLYVTQLAEFSPKLETVSLGRPCNLTTLCLNSFAHSYAPVFVGAGAICTILLSLSTNTTMQVLPFTVSGVIRSTPTLDQRMRGTSKGTRIQHAFDSCSLTFDSCDMYAHTA